MRERMLRPRFLAPFRMAKMMDLAMESCRFIETLCRDSSEVVKNGVSTFYEESSRV